MPVPSNSVWQWASRVRFGPERQYCAVAASAFGINFAVAELAMLGNETFALAYCLRVALASGRPPYANCRALPIGFNNDIYPSTCCEPGEAPYNSAQHPSPNPGWNSTYRHQRYAQQFADNAINRRRWPATARIRRRGD